MTRHLRVHTATDGARTLLRIGGEIDIDTAPQLRQALDTVLGSGARRVNVDMRAVTFCDSTGIHALLYARATAVERGIALTLVPCDKLRRLLDITGTAHLFTCLAFAPPPRATTGGSPSGPGDGRIEGASP
ncbi:STAS domain-containing protein (plasmid) [Embleya sp. NBC_00888]|uniref:STAS domain-containing protein n=1 Tax=Embleya sp. NBC_00888 TaxID=2975960 RepID=UPI002F90B16C|nr:STAS domain-containing protein [Embleya sp. NBC_00888]